MKRTTVMSLLWIGLTSFASLANASDPAPGWTDFNQLPERWLPSPYEAVSWYDQARDGAGWGIDKLPPAPGQTRPFYAATLYTYTASGSPYWLQVAATLQPPDWNALFRTGEAGRVVGTLFDGTGGACPTCAYVRPSIAPSPYGTGTLRFFGAGRTTVEMSGVVVDRVQAAEHMLFESVPALLTEGTWNARVYNGTGGSGGGGWINAGDNNTRLIQITPPSWAANITADANVLHVPNPQSSVWFVLSGNDTGTNFKGEFFPLILDTEKGTLIQYCFTNGAPFSSLETCGTAITQGVAQTRVGYRMAATAYQAMWVMKTHDLLVSYAFINDSRRSWTKPDGSPYVYSLRRVVTSVVEE